MEAPRLTISPYLREHMGYRKFSRGPVRVLILESHYWVDQACASAASRLGWRVAKARVAMQGVMSRELIQGFFEALVDLRPDFVLSVNLSGMDTEGLLARFLADLELPHVTWFVDDPRTILMGRTTYGSDYAVALTWEPAYADYLARCGFGAAHVLPLALDDALFSHPPADAPNGAPAFVGNSMRDYSAREYAALAQNPALAARVGRALDQGRVTRAGFARGVEAILGEDAAGLDAEALRRAELVFFIEGTRRLRHALVETLAPEGLVARGDEGWREVTAQWGPGIAYGPELAAFYRECPVNLNTTSIQMASAVNQRVFDCPGAGGFLLTDDQASLAELFDVAREVATYRTLDESREQLQWFMAHPASRREIVEGARRRILGEHTYGHRLEAMEGMLRERYAG